MPGSLEKSPSSTRSSARRSGLPRHAPLRGTRRWGEQLRRPGRAFLHLVRRSTSPPKPSAPVAPHRVPLAGPSAPLAPHPVPGDVFCTACTAPGPETLARAEGTPAEGTSIRGLVRWKARAAEVPMASDERFLEVAAIQASSPLFDSRKGVEKACRLIAEAAGSGARLILLPEAFLGGYPRGLSFGTVVGSRSGEGRDLYARYHEGALEVPGPGVERLGAAAAKAKAYVAVGAV